MLHVAAFHFVKCLGNDDTYLYITILVRDICYLSFIFMVERTWVKCKISPPTPPPCYSETIGQLWGKSDTQMATENEYCMIQVIYWIDMPCALSKLTSTRQDLDGHSHCTQTRLLTFKYIPPFLFFIIKCPPARVIELVANVRSMISV